jgi:hypothetical protein
LERLREGRRFALAMFTTYILFISHFSDAYLPETINTVFIWFVFAANSLDVLAYYLWSRKLFVFFNPNFFAKNVV